jgi:hypothetical protein
LKLKALRKRSRRAIGALERGDFVEVDDAGPGGYLEGLTAPSGKRACRSR